MSVLGGELLIDRKIERKKSGETGDRDYVCPVCSNGEVHIDVSVFYGRCDHCAATLIDFKPLPHQMAFFESYSPYKLLIGGFGSGKTTVSCFEDVYHALTTSNARILITAPTLQQLKQAVLPELNRFIPPWFLEGGKPQGNPPVYKFTNGSEILCYASDDEQKLRSLNLTRFHIEEGSGVKKEIFDQLQARLRNHAAIIRDELGREIGNKFQGVISTNPEDAWIKDDFLLRSSYIHGSESVDVDVYKNLMHSKRERTYASFISASFDNKMLPKGTIERISAGKSDRWKRKYLWSYLDFREGVVYGGMQDHFVEPFPIPDHWLRIGGYDPGISDPTACLLGAVDPATNTIYFYKEYYVTDQTITYHGHQLAPYIKPYKFMFPIQADPSVNRRSAESLTTYKQYFKQITDITLVAGNNDILLGIDKVRDYLYQGKIKIFNNLENFKREAALYAFQPVDKREKNTNNVPIDRHNHLMDCLRYAIAKLPNNPGEFKASYVRETMYKNQVVGIERENKTTKATTSANGRIFYGFKGGYR